MFPYTNYNKWIYYKSYNKYFDEDDINFTLNKYKSYNKKVLQHINIEDILQYDNNTNDDFYENYVYIKDIFINFLYNNNEFIKNVLIFSSIIHLYYKLYKLNKLIYY